MNGSPSPYAAGVVIAGDSGLNVDLGFIPTDSIFLNEWEQLNEIEAISRLYVVDRNFERVIRNCRQKFAGTIETITVVWNVEISAPYSYAMLALAREFPHRSFKIVGSTAHLEIAKVESSLCGLRTPPEDVRGLLIEQFRQPTSISVGELNLVLNDQEDLLGDLDDLVFKCSELSLENSVLRKRAEQLPRLYEKLRELQSHNDRLRKRNDALARKTFNRLAKQVRGSAEKNFSKDRAANEEDK